MGGGAGAGSGGSSGGKGGSGGVAGSAGKGGSAGSTAGTGGKGGSGGGSGGSGPCTPPSGTTCMTAADFCQGYAYMPMDIVKATCTVGTAGCLAGMPFLFRCVANCGAQVPGGTGFVSETNWALAGRCF